MTIADQSRTKSAYGLQWNRFRIIRSEEDRVTFYNRTGLSAGDLSGKVVLDAGCGMGRYLRIVAESTAGLIIGLELSPAVEAARELTRDLPRVGVVRGDLLRLPFAEGWFDVVYSLGVLDHTPDPRAAFMALARLVKPGGYLVVWVYPRERAIVECIMNVQRSGVNPAPIAVPGISVAGRSSVGRAQAAIDEQPTPAGSAAGSDAPSGDDRRIDAP